MQGVGLVQSLRNGSLCMQGRGLVQRLGYSLYLKEGFGAWCRLWVMDSFCMQGVGPGAKPG